MDFSLSEMQEMIRTSARDYLKTSVPKSLVRTMAEDSEGFPADIWQQMVEMGWMGLALPEEFGGAGGSYLDLVILLEEMGRSALPGPFFSTVVLGGLSILEGGNTEQKKELLPRLAAGKLFLTLAVLEDSAKYSAGDIQLKAIKAGEEFILDGRKLFVPDAHISNYIICAVRTSSGKAEEEGISLLLVDSKSSGITCNPLKTITGEKQSEIIFKNVKVPVANLIGELDKGWQILEKALQKATVARCAEMIGASRQIFEMSVDYAKQRKTFGHPIGSYQAIQHYLANMVTEVDGSELMINNAAWRLSEGLEADTEVAMAKAVISDSYKHIAVLGLQIHGAIGFTADHDLPVYYKRAKAWEISLGDSYYHLKKLAEIAGV
jgi:alkylation response protein AidB-like acyl-CoA dehydrogenase